MTFEREREAQRERDRQEIFPEVRFWGQSINWTLKCRTNIQLKPYMEDAVWKFYKSKEIHQLMHIGQNQATL